MAPDTVLIVEDHPLGRELVVNLFTGISEQHYRRPADQRHIPHLGYGTSVCFHGRSLSHGTRRKRKMKARLQWDRRTFLTWGISASLLLPSRQAVASEAAIAFLRIDGMT